jgi:uncharacterized Zn finger protein
MTSTRRSGSVPSFDDHRGDGGFFPPPSAPRKVQGGIRATARSGPMGTSWWARRWFAALEATGIDDRLRRGRDYARDGQVMQLDVSVGRIDAVVQGTRRTPYDTRIEVTQLDQLQWLQLARELARRADHHALLLGGTMPEDVEAVFARTGLSLFPSLEDDLRITCTCADWAHPCKHAAAVCYLVAEALDRDPFLAFRLRGIERDVLLAMLDGVSIEDAGAGASAASGGVDELDADGFWSLPIDAPPLDQVALDLQPPVLDAPLVQVLGALPMWRGATDFDVAMRRLYARIASDPRALDAGLGSTPSSIAD